jgi:hypothetical protein
MKTAEEILSPYLCPRVPENEPDIYWQGAINAMKKYAKQQNKELQKKLELLTIANNRQVNINDILLLDVRESYQKEFVEWAIKDQEIFFGELTEGYIINDNPYYNGNKLRTLDEIYNYWKENIKKV